MKAETCTFEVVSVIMYYKHISEKLTYIRKAPTRLKFIQDLSERKTRIEWVRQFMRELEENAIA